MPKYDSGSSVASTPRRPQRDRKEPTRFTIDHTPKLRRTSSKLSGASNDDEATETDEDEATPKKNSKATKKGSTKAPPLKGSTGGSGHGKGCKPKPPPGDQKNAPVNGCSGKGRCPRPGPGGKAKLPADQIDQYLNGTETEDGTSTAPSSPGPTTNKRVSADHREFGVSPDKKKTATATQAPRPAPAQTETAFTLSQLKDMMGLVKDFRSIVAPTAPIQQPQAQPNINLGIASGGTDITGIKQTVKFVDEMRQAFFPPAPQQHQQFNPSYSASVHNYHPGHLHAAPQYQPQAPQPQAPSAPDAQKQFEMAWNIFKSMNP